MEKEVGEPIFWRRTEWFWEIYFLTVILGLILPTYLLNRIC